MVANSKSYAKVDLSLKSCGGAFCDFNGSAAHLLLILSIL